MQAKQGIALALAFTAFLEARETAVHWNELAPLIVDRHVGLKLPDGTKLEGEVLAVRERELALNVTKSSNRKLHPKGQSVVAREGLMEVRVIKNSGPGKLVGSLLGVLGGLFGTGYSAAAAESTGLALAGLLVVTPIAAVAGYYLGKAADRRTTRITIAPETAGEARQWDAWQQ